MRISRLHRLVIFWIVLVSSHAEADPVSALPVCESNDGLEVCETRCSAGSQPSCAVLGILYLRAAAGGQKADYAEAEALLESACAADVALGCGGLGSLYGVQGNFERARPLFEKACTMGDPLSCESLGGILLGLDGSPRPPDPAAAIRRAMAYYKRACDLGAADPCAQVGAAIEDGIIPGTPREALDLYVTACNREVAAGCTLAAEYLDADTPASRALAVALDVPALSKALRRRACALEPSTECAEAR